MFRNVPCLLSHGRLYAVSFVVPFLSSTTYYYVADIYCSNFSELTPRQMLSVYDDLKEACGRVPRSGGRYVSTFCGDVFCGGHRYTIGSYLRFVKCDGVEIFDDYWNSQSHNDYLESNPEAAKSWKDQNAGLPYVGMPESRINSTILGKPSDVIRHNTEIKNGNCYVANLYDFNRNGKVIYTVRCVDGYVTETWDNRDSPASVPAYHAPTPSDDDPYDAASYSNEEDFYDDHYDDFFDFYDAEQYWRDHQE